MKIRITADEWYPVLGLGFKFDTLDPLVEITFDEFTDCVIAANLFDQAQELLTVIDKRTE